MINQLVNNIKKLDAPIVVGLDPMLDYVPDVYKRQMKYLGISKEQAKKEIETEDSKRYEFHKYYTNEIWGMSNGYELCLDEGILGIDGCVKMILDYLKIRNLI